MQSLQSLSLIFGGEKEGQKALAEEPSKKQHVLMQKIIRIHIRKRKLRIKASKEKHKTRKMLACAYICVKEQSFHDYVFLKTFPFQICYRCARKRASRKQFVNA